MIVRAIAKTVRDAGGRALLVGGCVRDELLGREPKDFDLEVFGVPADRLREILERLGRVETVGESFAVYKVGGVDVSLPRRESKTGRGHKGFAVTGDPGSVDRRGGAPPRFHDQRDLARSADRRDPRSRSTAAPTSTPAGFASSIRGRSPTTACASCARSSSSRASS